MHVAYEYDARGRAACPDADLVPGGRQARALEDRQRSRSGTAASSSSARKGMLLSDYGRHVLLPEKEFRDFKRPAAVHPQVAGPPRRVDSRLQDGRAHDLCLRLLGLADRGQSPGECRLSRGQEAGVGRRQAVREQRPRGRGLRPARVPHGMDAEAESTPNNRKGSNDHEATSLGC